MSLHSILTVLFLSASLSAMAGPVNCPSAFKDGQLIVDGKPFTLLAGELHNSTTGSVPYMRDVWKQMADKNLNTVIAAASWELVEPEEGKFNFREVDAMIDGARDAGLRLVVLWFGSWKNGDSSYTPSWVKLDQKVFGGANVHVVAIDTKQTPFTTIMVPEAGDLQAYVYLAAGWNTLVEIAQADGINLDKPNRARKVGNEM